jgi:hypothetical protein
MLAGTVAAYDSGECMTWGNESSPHLGQRLPASSSACARP